MNPGQNSLSTNIWERLDVPESESEDRVLPYVKRHGISHGTDRFLEPSSGRKMPGTEEVEN